MDLRAGLFGAIEPLGESRSHARIARELGAEWVGGSDERPPEELDAAILFAPVGALVPAALRAVRAGGVVVCGGIHMSDIPSFPYEILWGERVVRSVANLTRQDGREFLALAPTVPVRANRTGLSCSASSCRPRRSMPRMRARLCGSWPPAAAIPAG